MPGPILTDAQIAALEKDKAVKEATVQTFTAQVAAKDAQIAQLQTLDSSFKAFFDYYNGIITQYDTERKALDGVYIAVPISETDVLKAANLDGTGRITPSLPDSDVVRIDEFDGGNTTSTLVNETQHIADQVPIEDYLVTGGTGLTDPTVNAATVTASDLDSSSTTLDITDPATPITFTAGDGFVVSDGTNAALVRVETATPGGGSPPYTYALTITVLVISGGPILSGSTVKVFNGFTDGERSAKTASDPDFQPLLDELVTRLETEINNRKARLAEQIAAIDANQDPDGVAALAAAKTDAQTSDSFLTAYLTTTDVSDTGLASLATERGTRGSEITARVAEILAAYTGQTQNYYDQRYNHANNRANSRRGTLRLQKAAEAAKATSQALAASAQDAVDAYADILP